MLNELSTLRDAQLKLIDALRHIKEICQLNNIQFWIDSGTLLGAKRNGKFIPWDEDIDICMTRENYNRFIAIANDHLDQDKYFLQTVETDQYYSYQPVPCKLRLNNTCIDWTDQNGIYYNYDRRSHSGLYIDIFPMDNAKQYSLHRRIIHYSYKIYYLNRFNNISTTKKIVRTLFNLLLSRKKIDLFNYKFACKVNKKESDYIDYSLDMGLTPYNFPKKLIFPLDEITFEGITLPCPRNVHNYLVMLYGNNYLIPPSDPYQHGIVKFIFDKEYNNSHE
ncbi:LicD family protein [Morganella psychrotolerans]|uniref:LicD family protein n=1 Tax=Morganella psychrotolerans TaxID=368603 RepID=A0A5M9QZ15_9GAMM|nr:LicD family protein [Morganella psychrotolerans]KAA8713239.1 LicD family protein [Morganella psychrotolerans]